MSQQRHRVLIVEDNLDSAMSLVMLINHLGHDVQYALNGDSALTMARQMQPDIVLLDIGLPGMDGYQLARLLRREFGGALRIIAVTGYGTEADRQRSAEAGIDQHVIKPAQADLIAGLLG